MPWVKLNEPAGTPYSLPSRIFPADNPWNTDISQAPLDPRSADYIAFFSPLNDYNVKPIPDFGDIYGQPYITVSGDYPKVRFHHMSYLECSDDVPYPIPVEANTVPGWSQQLDGTLNDDIPPDHDRHIVMVDGENQMLYEVYNPFHNGTDHDVVCRHGRVLPPDAYCCASARAWDLTSNDPVHRGSTNAAGVPYWVGTFTFDEATKTGIKHALGQTFNFSAKTPPYFVFPATDYAPGGANSPIPGENGIGHPPFGARFRLKASYQTVYKGKPTAEAIVACLKTYGTIFMDNGANGMLGGSQEARWGDSANPDRLYLFAELCEMRMTDFEVVQLGWTPDSPPPPPVDPPVDPPPVDPPPVDPPVPPPVDPVPPARWSPTYTPNGWYPKLNYPWVAFGFGECFLENLVTGEWLRVRENVRTQAAGWLDAKTLCYYCGELPAIIFSMDVESGGIPRTLGTMNINRVVARNGSWATGLAAGGVVTLNGQEIARGVGWRVDVDGPVLACEANDGVHVWANGQPKPTLAPKTTLVDPVVRGDHVGYGYNGPARIADLRSGQDDDVTITPWKKESAPIRLDGWIWTTTEKKDRTSAALGRPVGASDCLVLPVESAVGLDVQRVGDYWIVATYGSQGQLVVQSIRVDAPRVPLAPPEPPPVVTVPPAPAHLTMCGYFYRDTNVHAYLAKYGGENKEAPGTHSIIVDDHGMPAETRQNGTTPRMVIGLGQLLHNQLEGWWDSVDAVYVAKEGDEDGLRSLMDLARYIMAFRNLAPKPILTYSAREVYPNVHRPTDILGIQLYAEQGTDPVRNIREQAAWYRAKTAHVPRVAIIGQAFDRSVGWTGPQLASIQPELYALACEWPNCEGLFWFSDSRKGGTRDHEEMRPWHIAIADAISKR